MQQYFAEDEPFISVSNRPAGPQPVHVARLAKSYAISVDTTAKLRWASGELDGDHLICCRERTGPRGYLSMLLDKGISYIVADASSVDLVMAVDLLGEHLRIRRLLLEGGGHINGRFARAWR